MEAQSSLIAVLDRCYRYAAIERANSKPPSTAGATWHHQVVEGGDRVRIVRFEVQSGEIVQTASWVYVWLAGNSDRRAIYVGATGMNPSTRAWLHLHHDDPEIGRILARYPAAKAEALAVFAVQLPDHISRQEMRAAVTARLRDEGLLSTRYVGDPPDTDIHLEPEAAPYVDQLAAAVARHVSDKSN